LDQSNDPSRVTATHPPTATPQADARRWPVSGARAWILELTVGFIAFLTALATFLMLSGAGPIEPSELAVRILLIVNVVLAIVLISAIVWRLYNLSRTRASGVAGAQLHVRLVMVFAAIAIVPTVMVAVFSAVMLNLGIDAWFSARVKTAIDNAASVAEAYVEEHKQSIQADVLGLASAVNRQLVLAMSDPVAFQEYLTRQAGARNLSAAVIYDGNGNRVTGVRLTFLVEIEAPPIGAFQRAAAGEVVILADGYDDRVQALVKLEGFIDRYLLAIRYVDTKVLSNQRQTIDAAGEYARLETNRTNVQLTFAAVYGVVGLLMLLAAVSLGLSAANRIVTPIGRLIGAAERVSAGDLTARVETHGADGELGTLTSAFNRMTSELQSQQDELVEANREAEDRRLFAEAVLSGVSAGVVGLDALGRIDAANPSAAEVLGVAESDLAGRPIEEIAPEIASLLAEARTNATGKAVGQLDLVRGGRSRILSVRVSSERTDGRRSGFVVTFDDMTDLVAAQRSSAWGDIARRIAHEIKNPLTPIQLSAERLRRKYGKEIVTDPAVFEQCTQTIIRQVGDIGRMVDEFSTFARMPAPTMREEDAADLVRQTMFLQSVGNPSVEHEYDGPEGVVSLVCDGRLVAQALTNVLKNAAEGVSARFDPDGPGGEHHTGGRIVVRLRSGAHDVTIEVEDNGIGLPRQDRDKLTEPYVTTRRKGTGLGLAIVKKVMEDHHGSLGLADAPTLGGALVTLTIPLRLRVSPTEEMAHEQSSELA
jgi:two-component system nitrogen regulation sensor histidine kinase NtrY